MFPKLIGILSGALVGKYFINYGRGAPEFRVVMKNILISGYGGVEGGG